MLNSNFSQLVTIVKFKSKGSTSLVDVLTTQKKYPVSIRDALIATNNAKEINIADGPSQTQIDKFIELKVSCNTIG